MNSQLKSPFPGMNPFLEMNPRWQEFHGWFIRELARLNSSKAREAGCLLGVERSIYQREPDGQLVLVGELDAFAGPDLSFLQGERPIQPGNATALVEPKAVHEVTLDPSQMELYKQDYLVVRQAGRFTRILAVLELLSFANKEGSYAPKYREKRMRLLTSQAHFMEIDFLRGGENPSRLMFPELQSTPYFIFVARKTGCGRNEEGYPIRLQERLPVIGLPIGLGRPDLPLDLAAAFESAVSLCIEMAEIRYQDEPVPDPPLSTEDADWIKSQIDQYSLS
ncbi:MAG: hypothetical protein JWM11_2491 [Planctomycetaceae bacterium]|nr:hypothetical protein [Planctomycetaceae bacterium]